MAPKAAKVGVNVSAPPRSEEVLKQKAEKALEDNCKRFTNEQKFVQKSTQSGKTMFETVLQELKKKNCDPNYKVGALRWKEIKAEFVKKVTYQSALQIDGPEETQGQPW